MIRKISKNLVGVLAFSVITLSTILCFIPIFLLAIVKLLIPLAWLRRQTTRWIIWVGACWVDFNALMLAWVNDTEWDIRGLEGLSPDKWYLVIANHQTWTDIVVLQTIFSHRIPFLKFFIKQQLVWFPFLGIAWWAMDMPFMRRYPKSYLAKHPEKKGRDLEATRKACEKFRTTPTTVINFIEGTRFSEEKKKKRVSPFQHLLPPRAGGIALALSSMGDMFDAIVDVTILYPTGPTKFWDMFCGDLDRLVVVIEKRPVCEWMVVGDYSNDRDFRSRFHRWLTEIWHEKDRKIDALLEETRADLS